MSDFLFDTSNRFVAYSAMHWYPILSISLLMLAAIYFARQLKSKKAQIWFGTALALIPPLSVLFRMIFTGMDGTFSIQEELPFHLCRLMAFVMPFVIFYRSRKWFGITYFFVIVGTLQALLTPDLPQAAPHFSYFIYWLLHGILIYLPVYCIVVFRFDIRKKDFVNAVIVGNVYLLFTLIINYFLGSNYFYTNHKPPVASLLDYLGPWPWYILIVEILAILLFVVAWMPFWFGKKRNLETTI